MYIVVDTETTGLSPKTERVVEFGWVILDADLNEVKRVNRVVTPEGYAFRPSPYHGVTADIVAAEGRPIRAILDEFLFDCGLGADQTPRTLVCHNVRFDRGMIAAEIERAGIDTAPFLAMADICTLALSGRQNLGKWHTKLFGHGFDDAHRALPDALACAACFRKLRAVQSVTDTAPVEAAKEEPTVVTSVTAEDPDAAGYSKLVLEYLASRAENDEKYKNYDPDPDDTEGCPCSGCPCSGSG